SKDDKIAHEVKRMEWKKSQKKILTVFLCMFIAVLCAGCLKKEETAAEPDTEVQKKNTEQIQEKTEEKKPEDEIYSYLQGIKSYEKGKKWSGEWCYEEAGGQQFSQFGCGICSLANIYSTLGKAECTPLEMYEYAQKVSSYNPHSGLGAIGWDAIRVTLQKSGFTCDLGRKPETYEEFQNLAKEGKCLMVLISSEFDDTYWKDMPGHYVTLWLYDEKTDEVFLADSSGPSKNRKWIPLRYVYDALKTSSPQQYLMITGYQAEEDGWVREIP
ncbi:MAG: C39 family peptidase, partial [Lachnospiraceae bacterium]